MEINKLNRTILITGATGVFGKTFVKYFLSKGDNVIAVSRSMDNLKELKKFTVEERNNLTLIAQDLMENNFENILLKKLTELKLKPCCLINNARSVKNLKINDFGSIPEKQFVDEYKLGIIVPYKMIISLIRSKGSNLKKVVNIGSIYGEVAPNRNLKKLDKDPIHYGLTKAALVQLTKELAVRFAGKGININCVSYGGVEGRVDDFFKERYSELCPSRKMLKPENLSLPVDMLFSPGSEAIHGHTLMVDGGWTIW